VSEIASALVCAMKFANSFDRWQNPFDITKTLTDVIDWKILSYQYPAPLSVPILPKMWWPPANFIKIHSVFLWLNCARLSPLINSATIQHPSWIDAMRYAVTTLLSFSTRWQIDCKGVRCPPIFSLSNLIDAGWL